MTEKGNKGALTCSPDCRVLVSGDERGTVTLWNVTAEQRICQLTGHLSSIHDTAFTPNGRTLATAGTTGDDR